MNDEFVTQALQEDRYLKAVRLTDRLETELERELERSGDNFVAENRSLFRDNVDASTKVRPNSASHIAYIRASYEMIRIPEADSSDNLELELYLRWVDPDKFGFTNCDGALCAASYKIKNALREDHKEVERLTEEGDWDVQCADDPHGRDPGTFYIPVETASEIREAYDNLSGHFSEFGTMYGMDLG